MKLSRSIHIPRSLPRATAATAAALVIAGILAFASPAFARPLVVIDAGHGGIYNHARYGTLLEKQANLLIAFELGRQLYAAGYDVQFTRITDTAITYGDLFTWHWVADRNTWVFAPDNLSSYPDGVPRDDLQGRVNIANDMGADIFISVHNNGSGAASANGTENWASSRDVLGQQLGQYVQAAVLEQTRQRNRGAGQQDFYVVRWTNMPALLLEVGFMSNPAEGSLIASPAWRARYASGVVNGVNRWWATNPVSPIRPRYAGATHSQTAVIASRTQWPSGASTVLLAHTLDIASAYAAPVATARLGAPLLYVDFRQLSPETSAELARLKPSRIVAFGSQIPDSVLAEAAAAAGIDVSAVQRIAGSEPSSAAALLSGSMISTETPTPLVFASGASQSDALAGATLAASRGAALLLSRADGSLPPEAAAFLAERAGKITEVLVIGNVPAWPVDGLPGRTTVGLWEPNQIFGAAALAARPTGGTWLYGFNPTVPTDALLAVSAAANRLGGVPVPLPGRYMAPYTREWLENSGHRVIAATMVGDFTAVPAAAEHYVQKAIY